MDEWEQTVRIAVVRRGSVEVRVELCLQGTWFLCVRNYHEIGGEWIPTQVGFTLALAVFPNLARRLVELYRKKQ